MLKYILALIITAPSSFLIGAALTITQGDIIFGSSGELSYLTADPAQGQLVISLGDALGKGLIIGDADNYGKDYDHALFTYPTLCVHSGTDPDSVNTEYICFHHDGTNGVIYSGSGQVTFNDTVKPQNTDSPVTCVAALEGAIYYDLSMNEICVCSDNSGGYQWDQADTPGTVCT